MARSMDAILRSIERKAAIAEGRAKPRATSFARWLDLFLSEKGIQPDEILTVPGPSGANWMPVGVLVDMIKKAAKHEQEGIKAMLVRIDFKNASVRDYLKHLARAVAR